MNFNSKTYLPLSIFHIKEADSKYNLHIVLDASEQSIEIKRILKGTHNMSHKYFDLPDNMDWLELLRREIFEDIYLKQKDTKKSVYTFVFYDDQNHKKSIVFDNNDNGPVQRLLSWIKTEYEWTGEF